MNSLHKHSKKLVLLVLVILLLFTSLGEIRAAYFTGYLDLKLKKEIESDVSFFLKDNLAQRIDYMLKYDSQTTADNNYNKRDSYLDNSILINDLSEQKEYFKANYKKYSLLYGEYNMQIKNPIFSDYYDKESGVKLSSEGTKNKLAVFLSKDGDISKTDKVLNPNYSVIFLSSRDIRKDSLRIYVNILNKENRLVKIAVLGEDKDYTVDYLNGRISFNPVIFFLNNPKYNYELIINYKIKGNTIKNLNKGYHYSNKILPKTKLKVYEVREDKKRSTTGSVLKFTPDNNQKYILEYQRIEERENNTNLSINNGHQYIKDPIRKKTEEKKGIKFKKSFNDNIILTGYKLKTIFQSKTNRYIEDEQKLKYITKLSKKLKTDLSYWVRQNNLERKEHQYKAHFKSKLNSNLKLDTTYLEQYDSLDRTLKKSLDNFFGYQFSENSYIYWGYLHNLTTKKGYGQYGLEFKTAGQSTIKYKNKVIDTEYRKESYQYKQDKGFELFKYVKCKLDNNQFVKKSQGIKYPINERSFLSLIKNEYNQLDINTENIVKYQLRFNNKMAAGINFLEYRVQAINEKRLGLRGTLNYEIKDNKVSLNYEQLKNRSSLYQKQNYDISLKKVIGPDILIQLLVGENNEKDRLRKFKSNNRKHIFNFKYRPINKAYKFYYKYHYSESFNKEGEVINKEVINENNLNFIYQLNKKLSLNTNLQKYIIKQNINNNLIENMFSLNSYGLSYNFAKEYFLKLEYKTFIEGINNEKQPGYLIGIKRRLKENLYIGLEYNFTDFNNELIGLDQKTKGLSLNINYNW